MTDQIVRLNVEEIAYDEENPRIRGALEKYGDKINAARIAFALQSSNDEGADNGSGYQRLKISIRANRGIADPIRVIRQEERLVCIDGNTRLAIYKEFAKKDGDKSWDTIPAVVLDNPSQREIETIRVTAHLVGAREWPAYEKAKYLRYLRYEELMDFEDIVALCGGNRRDIQMQIDAFDDMNEYYRDRVEDSAFQIDRFSGFVELQKGRVKDAIFAANYELSDFGDWIGKGNLKPLSSVRQLPRILANPEATKILVEGGPGSAKRAIHAVDSLDSKASESAVRLDGASIEDLARVLVSKLEGMTVSDLDELKSSPERVANLADIHERLTSVLGYVGK